MSCFAFSFCNTNVEGATSKKTKKDLTLTRKGYLAIHTALSMKTGSSRRRIIESEIKRIGHAKNAVKTFSFEELAAATDNFDKKNVIGEGGFGLVFKGYLKSVNRDVAVKQLNREGSQGSREFFQEVLMLSLVQHANLVHLIGYCVDDDHRILVYEYMEKGCLENHLLDLAPDKEPLNWLTRMKIAKGAAQGLEYLHDISEPQIIYRDFKASNILLDQEFNPKLSDFGLAKIGPTEGDDHVCTRVMGTYGYCAPEYVLTGKLTKKSDVYSFGVVFLELITGRRAIDKSRVTAEQNLIDWAQPLLQDRRKFPQMADPLLDGKYPEKGLFKALAIAAMCLQEDPDPRPSMGDVVAALELLSDEQNEDESADGENVELVKATCGKDNREA